MISVYGPAAGARGDWFITMRSYSDEEKSVYIQAWSDRLEY